uniref:(northern house mosquito) hypothetical protein n=1 Tax=Culex pipiens TaxID=7175 RepID=A0A8D8IL51_CULPI
MTRGSCSCMLSIVPVTLYNISGTITPESGTASGRSKGFRSRQMRQKSSSWGGCSRVDGGFSITRDEFFCNLIQNASNYRNIKNKLFPANFVLPFFRLLTFLALLLIQPPVIKI